MQRAVFGANRWRASALLFSLASGLAAAQQFQPLSVSTEVPEGIAEVQAKTLVGQDVSPPVAGEPDRVPSGVGQRGSVSEEPNADDLCARATASRADYIPIWRAEFLRRNAMTAAYFDEHVTVIDTNVQCWQTGATFRVRYRVSYEWTSAELTDGFYTPLRARTGVASPERAARHAVRGRGGVAGHRLVDRLASHRLGRHAQGIAVPHSRRGRRRTRASRARRNRRDAAAIRRRTAAPRRRRRHQQSGESLLSRFARFGHRRGLRDRGAVPDRRAMAGDGGARGQSL